MIFAASWIMASLLTAYHLVRDNVVMALSLLATPIVAYVLTYFFDSALLSHFAFGSLMGILTLVVLMVVFNFYWSSFMHDKNLRKSWDLDQH